MFVKSEKRNSLWGSLVGGLYLVNICTVHTNCRHCWSSASAVHQSTEVIIPHYRLNISVVGVSLLQARRPGIRCQTVFATQHWVSTCLGISWGHTFWEILTRCTQCIRGLLIMRYIILHFTYLLTDLSQLGLLIWDRVFWGFIEGVEDLCGWSLAWSLGLGWLHMQCFRIGQSLVEALVGILGQFGTCDYLKVQTPGYIPKIPTSYHLY